MKKSNLNIRQLKFIDNLFQGMTQIKAYTEAGYSPVEANASRLIRNDKVIAEIKRRLDDIDFKNRIRLGRISETALAKLLVIIQNDDVDNKTKLDAIKDALDRAGLKPIEEHKIKLEEVGDLADAKKKLISKLDSLAAKKRKRQNIK